MPNDEPTITAESVKAVPFPGTLRDWFAGMALQVVDAAQGPEAMACEAYLIADAMLREREKAT